jgi:hypothetical protein
MRGFLCAMVFLAVLGAAPVPADEFAGKLERIDRQTVTLLGPDQTRLVLRVDEPSIQKAAALVGKSVSVEFAPQEGHNRLLLFRPLLSEQSGR